MRHFHNSASSVFITFAVNDEYFRTVEQVGDEFEAAVGRALEIPQESCNRAFTAAIGLLANKKGQATLCRLDDINITPNETDVIWGAAKWMLSILREECGPLSTRKPSRSWSYFNLNTGVGVTWTHLYA